MSGMDDQIREIQEKLEKIKAVQAAEKRKAELLRKKKAETAKKHEKLISHRGELNAVARDEKKLRIEAESEHASKDAVERREALRRKVAIAERKANIAEAEIELREAIEKKKRAKAEAAHRERIECEKREAEARKKCLAKERARQEAMLKAKSERIEKELNSLRKKRDLNKTYSKKREFQGIHDKPVQKRRVYVIAGPTAVGKSAVAIMLARKIDGEIVNCDSVQIYKYLDIGSAKPSYDTMKKVPHHLYGIIDPREQMNVAQYQKLAIKTIEDILSRGKVPIICGGTGLYLNSILYDMKFGAKPQNQGRRKELEEMADKRGAEYLFEYLTAVDPEAAARIHPNNTRKVIRAIESWELGTSIKSMKECKHNPNYDFKVYALSMEREWLYERINMRVLKLIKAGFIDEVKGLKRIGLNSEYHSMKAIGYREIFEYLDGKKDMKTAITDIMKGTRHYAKRQLTWLRKYDGIHWIEIHKGDKVSGIVQKILRDDSDTDYISNDKIKNRQKKRF